MERNCTQTCVAYSTAIELSEGTEEMGMKDMHCMRLFLDLAEFMSLIGPEELEDEDAL